VGTKCQTIRYYKDGLNGCCLIGNACLRSYLNLHGEKENLFDLLYILLYLSVYVMHHKLFINLLCTMLFEYSNIYTSNYFDVFKLAKGTYILKFENKSNESRNGYYIFPLTFDRISQHIRSLFTR
jgi:hypothetical protein